MMGDAITNLGTLLTVSVCVSSLALLDMTINQFLKSVGLEHLREIFHREQVCVWVCGCVCVNSPKKSHYHKTVLYLIG